MSGAAAPDPSSLERTGTVRKVGGDHAVWSLSSCSRKHGVDQLLDDRLDTYWQSSGRVPHEINIQFFRKTAIQAIYIYVDYERDQSYTPKRISVNVGTTFHDLRVIDTVDLDKPEGWVHIQPQDSAGRPVRAWHLQIAVLSNHLDGINTRVRQVKLYSPRVQEASVSVLPGITFTSAECRAFSSGR